MTAFQILEMKHFMAKLLTEDCFDSFLLEKASVSCAVSYEIDGRVNPEAQGLLQLEKYLDRLNLANGFLVIFDQRVKPAKWALRMRTSAAKTATGRQVWVMRG